jgi:hypothetical protein
MAIHIAYVRPTLINTNSGDVVDKNDPSTPASAVYSDTESQPRVQPGANAPNGSLYPTIENYLLAEDAAGYTLRHMDNTMIVTQT